MSDLAREAVIARKVWIGQDNLLIGISGQEDRLAGIINVRRTACAIDLNDAL